MCDKFFDIVHTSYLKRKYRGVLCCKNIRFRRDTQLIISNGGKMEIGSDCNFQIRVSLVSAGGALQIGNSVAFNRNCIVVCRQEIVIEDDCIFGPNVVIYDHDHLYSKRRIEKEKFKCDKIIIEPGCWIGANVTILRGTHIGRNSVIGAGTVVKGDIPPDSIVVSNREVMIKPLR